MKKYLQITVVLGAFFFLVFLRSAKGDEEANPIIGKSQVGNVAQITPTDTPVVPTSTPASTNSNSPAPTAQPTATPTPTPKPKGQYKDGTYTGSVEDAFYGNYQVQAIISGGKLSNVNLLQYPNDNRTSLYINSQAGPMLVQEAIQAQNANVDVISGASDSSGAFIASLTNALNQAH